VPGEALLVERDDHLGTFDVGLLGRDQVGLVGVLPVDFSNEEKRYERGMRRKGEKIELRGKRETKRGRGKQREREVLDMISFNNKHMICI